MEKEVKGFFEAIFDFSFSDFVTTKLIRFIYGAAIFLGGLFGIASIIGGFSRDIISGIIALILASVLYTLGIVVLRIWLELVMVIFKIEENTRR